MDVRVAEGPRDRQNYVRYNEVLLSFEVLVHLFSLLL